VTERRRVHLLGLLLALGGFGGAAGAYVAFGPSASSDQAAASDTLIGVGHAQVGTAGIVGTVGTVRTPSYAARPHGRHQFPHQQHGSGHGHVGVGGHAAHHQGHIHPHHGSGHGPKPTTPGTSPTPGANNRLDLHVGDLTGLWPGRTARLPVTYTNPKPFAVSVTSVVVDTPGTKACGGQYFVTGTYRQAAPVQIPGRASVSTTVPFGMKLSAPNACQGAAVRVDVTATAVKR